jgi:hypothetical protein
MASSIGVRVRGYVSDAVTADVNKFLYPALYDVVNAVLAKNISKFPDFSYSFAFTDTTSIPPELGLRAVGSVFQKGRSARYMSPQRFYDVQDSKSLHLATEFDPVFTYMDGDIACFPTTGLKQASAELINYGSALDEDDTTISHFPTSLLDAVAMQISLRCLASEISGASVTLSGLTIPTLDLSTVTAPKDASSNDINILAPVDLVPTITTTADFSSVLTEIASFIDDDWDETLANAKAVEFGSRVQDFLTQIDAKLKKWNAEFQEYSANNSRYQLALARYQADINKAVSEFSGELQSVASSVQKATATIGSHMQQMAYIKDMYIATIEGYIG